MDKYHNLYMNLRDICIFLNIVPPVPTTWPVDEHDFVRMICINSTLSKIVWDVHPDFHNIPYIKNMMEINRS